MAKRLRLALDRVGERAQPGRRRLRGRRLVQAADRREVLGQVVQLHTHLDAAVAQLRAGCIQIGSVARRDGPSHRLEVGDKIAQRRAGAVKLLLAHAQPASEGREIGAAGAGVGQPERPPDRVDRTGDHLLGLRSDVCLGVGSAHLELRELVRIDAMLLAAERDEVQLAGVELTLLRNEEEAVGLRREEDRQRCGIFTRAAHATHPALSGGGSSGVRMCASKRSR